MEPNLFATTLFELTGNLKSETAEERKALENLRESLAKTLVRQPEEVPLPTSTFHFGRTDVVSGLSLETKPVFREMEDLIGRVTDSQPSPREPAYQVFRRSTPARSSLIPGSIPSWGSGAAVDRTIGPFVDDQGLQYWFDFYIITKTVRIYFGNDSVPAILVPLRLGLLSSSSTNRYNIDDGSIWIRSNLFTPQAPAGYFTGLKINGGRLTLSQTGDLTDDVLKVPANTNLEITLRLVQGDALPDSGDNYGIDAQNADLTLPDGCQLRVLQNSLTIEELAGANWQVYNDERSFSFDPGNNNEYVKVLDRIAVPLNTEPNVFSLPEGNSQSEPIAISGEAGIHRGAWLLPLAAIEVTAPPAAAGSGGLAIHCDGGIVTSWPGLKKGPASLNDCWLQVEPGTIIWTAEKASNMTAHQKYQLWANEETGFFSEVHLQYTEAFRLQYYSLNFGMEAVYAQADVDFQTDRPVTVNGRPFEIKGKESLYLLVLTAAKHHIMLFDENIIIDNAAVSASGEPVFSLEAKAIALNNALLKVTQPATFLLLGEVSGVDQLSNGSLNLLHGLFNLIPTLPDPYAANLASILRDQGFRTRENRSVAYQGLVALLICTVKWPPADPEAAVKAEVGYRFLAPARSTNYDIGFRRGTHCGGSARPTFAVNTDTPTGTVTNVAPTTGATLFAVNIPDDQYQPSEYEGVWQQMLSLFGTDAFSLLDVSTNADLLGVSYGCMSERTLLVLTHRPQDDANEEIDYSSLSEPTVPYQIEGMDLKASGKYVKAFTVPQISWEPLINLSDESVKAVDPPVGVMGFENDGGPTKIFNDSPKTVTLAPIPVSNFLIEEFKDDEGLNTFSVFTLPFGLQAIAQILAKNQFDANDPGANIDFNRPDFSDNVKGGIQFKAIGAVNSNENNRIFQGNTIQLTNGISSKPNKVSVLGDNVSEIFNGEFSAAGFFGPFAKGGVPVEEMDISGYGASMFSHWLNAKAEFAQTSQAKFDVWVGRTAHEIIQVRSVIYPWGIRVVRTITMFRVGSAYVYRLDSGWRAESDGLFDFNVSVDVNEQAIPAATINAAKQLYAAFDETKTEKNLKPYEFHPGIVKGVFNVKNIKETNDYPAYIEDTFIDHGEAILNANRITDLASGGEVGGALKVKLTPVYFTADVAIDFAKEGAVDGKVPSKKMLGFVQLSPPGVPIPREIFEDFLKKYPDIGGEVDCVVNIGESGQMMRVSRVEVNTSKKSGNIPIFAGVAKGAPILPPDGSWSMVQHQNGTDEVTPLSDNYGVPLIREGEWIRHNNGTWSANQAGKALRLAGAADMILAPTSKSIHFGFLQNTGTQKALFRMPNFQENKKQLFSEKPDFADAYRLLNSKGIFPKLSEITSQLDLAAENIDISIIKEGYKLVEAGQDIVEKAFDKTMNIGPWYWVGSENGDEPVKIYIEYQAQAKNEPLKSTGINFDLNSQAKKWTSKLNETTIVVDLGECKRLFFIRGNFDAEKGTLPTIGKPVLEFGPTLQPIYEVLQLLVKLSEATDPFSAYKDILEKGLEIAMSNTAEVWDYKFSAKKEIPVIRFPPATLDGPTTPLRLEASLSIGCYFNESIPQSLELDQMIPSAGAFVEFGGQIEVMCVSLAAATVYAIGNTKVRMYGDLKQGIGLAMRHGFGVKLSVGLPVIGNVSVEYSAGISMDINVNILDVQAFLRFQGRAELIGGLVTVTIWIEASGGITRNNATEETLMTAQVTFGLDISIFLVINIHFEESWQESRQIA